MPNAASREWREGRPSTVAASAAATASGPVVVDGFRRGPGVGDGVLVDAEELVDVLLGHEAGAVGVLGRGAELQERRRGPIHPGERLGESARAIAEEDSVDPVLDQLWERPRRRRHRSRAARHGLDRDQAEGLLPRGGNDGGRSEHRISRSLGPGDQAAVVDLRVARGPATDRGLERAAPAMARAEPEVGVPCAGRRPTPHQLRRALGCVQAPDVRRAGCAAGGGWEEVRAPGRSCA